MTLTKRQAFLTTMALWLLLSVLYQSLWLFSRTMTADIYAADAATGRSRRNMPRMYAAYTVDATTYQGSYFRNEMDVSNGHCEIRYLIFAPDISRKNSFAGNWGYTLVCFVFLSLITAVLFIRKDIIFIPLQYKQEFYAIDDIDAAVVYLESFDGFEYRERTTMGNATSTSSGDNNKISFRYKGTAVDFTFILDQFSDYWSFKNLMSGWSARGVNVLLQKVFEDEFVIQQIAKFNTPVELPAES